MKSQISVTISVIKKVDYTIRKLQIDKQTFNKNLPLIENAIINGTDNIILFKIKTN